MKKGNARPHRTIRARTFILLSVFILVATVVAVPIYSVSSSSAPARGSSEAGVPTIANVSEVGSLPVSDSRALAPWANIFGPLSPEPLPSLTGIATFASDGTNCTSAKTDFNLGEWVCAKATGVPVTIFSWHVSWVDPVGFIVQSDTAIADDQATYLYHIPATATSVVNDQTVSNVGTWRVNLTRFSGAILEAANFTVHQPSSPTADVFVQKFARGGNNAVPSGDNIPFIIVVGNNGPDAAVNVHLVDSAPSGFSLASFTQQSGSPCLPADTSDCTMASMAGGDRAEFTAVYNSGATAQGTYPTSATVSNDTADPDSSNNTSSSDVLVTAATGGGTCSLTCPTSITAEANTTEGGQRGAHVDFDVALGSGSCGAVSSTPASGSFFPVGTTPVNASSATGGGSCSFSITVTDQVATISCPANITVAANSGQSEAFVPDPNGSSSNVGTATANGGQSPVVNGSRDDGKALTDAYPIGVTLITWTSTDSSGSTLATCTQTITVTSPDAPTISCPSDRTFTAPSGSCQITVLSEDIGLPTTTGPSVTVTNERSDGLNLTAPYPAGDTFITWTATNSIGTASCTQKIHVNATDNTPPTLTVPPDVNATTSSCTATLDDELGVATATDNCTASVNITRTGVPRIACPVPGDPGRTCESFVFPTGTTTITYTATDAAGNTTVGTQLVTVLESPAIPPTITAPGDLTFNTGPSATTCGTFVGDATLGSATANDNCPGVTVARTGVPAGNNFPVGDTIITYTATDRSGNTATATQKVTVVDNTLPVVTAPGPVTLYTGAGATSCSVTVSDLNTTLGTGSATDNCPGVGSVTRSGVPVGNVFPVGDTIVTYSATDAHGNTGSATQTVTVVDNTPPTISCPANITLEPTCPSGAIATYAAPVVGDNCGVQGTLATTSPTVGLASGSVFPIGTTTVLNTVTDIHGNSNSCSFTVTVKTVSQTIADLRASVNSSSLNGTQKQGLIAKLDAATDALATGHTNTACTKLLDFINSTQNYIDHGNITAAVGNAWINTAAHVRNTIGCTNNPCT